MKLYDLSIPIIVIGTAIAILISAVGVWKLGQSNPIVTEAEDLAAEGVEEIIEKKAGIDIPLEKMVQDAQQVQIKKAQQNASTTQPGK